MMSARFTSRDGTRILFASQALADSPPSTQTTPKAHTGAAGKVNGRRQ